jgi:hypothetical protein
MHACPSATKLTDLFLLRQRKTKSRDLNDLDEGSLNCRIASIGLQFRPFPAPQLYHSGWSSHQSHGIGAAKKAA